MRIPRPPGNLADHRTEKRQKLSSIRKIKMTYRLTQRQKRMVNGSKAKEGLGRIHKTHTVHIGGAEFEP